MAISQRIACAAVTLGVALAMIRCPNPSPMLTEYSVVSGLQTALKANIFILFRIIHNFLARVNLPMTLHP